MSRNIIAVSVLWTLTLSAAAQERRAEIATASLPALTAVKGKLPDDGPPNVAMPVASGENAHVLPDLVAAPPVIPLGPADLLRAYELAMASIAERLSMELAVISNAAGTGQITREQGEFASGERYQVAIMQFQLFSTLHAMLEADIALTPPVRTDSTSPSAGDQVLVAIPFSSLQLSPSLVEYLGLTPSQVRSIQKLMDQERPITDPLMQELRTISGKLGAALEQSQSKENEGTPQRQKLAATQAQLLKQLMRANSRLQRRINEVLDPQQRKKLDSLKRTSEVTVGDEN